MSRTGGQRSEIRSRRSALLAHCVIQGERLKIQDIAKTTVDNGRMSRAIATRRIEGASLCYFTNRHATNDPVHLESAACAPHPPGG